ncbi:MAG: hypothetical protein Q4A28_09165 [Brachymonas sp.]|nr:hypothetical protein [Brachymonas sp.]
MKKKFLYLRFLSFCLLTLAASTAFLHTRNEKKWENQTRASEAHTHSGASNPYRTDEFVYTYGTYDSIGERRNSQRCIFYMYSLLSNQDSDTKSTLEYLRQFDQEDLKKFRKNIPSTLFTANNKIIKSTWMFSKDLKAEMFESFNGTYEALSGYMVPNPKELKHYEIFDNCRSFGLDLSSIDKKQYYKRTGFVFFEEFKNRRTKRKYNQDTLIKIIQDPETLVKVCVFRKGTRKGGVISNFYSTKYNAYVLMDVSNGMVSPYKWIHPRCY